MSAATIVWFRQDLRLADHPPLQAALRRGEPIIPLYIWSPEEEGDWAPGGASKVWLHHALKDLDQNLQAIGSRLILRSGRTLDVLEDVMKESKADAVYWTRRYEPDIIERDTSLKSALKEKNIQVTTYNGSLLFEPWEVSTKSDTPYKVFTPYYKQCMTQLEDKLPFEKPDQLPRPQSWPDSEPLESWDLEPRINWAEGIKEAWAIGETGGLDQMDRFIDEGLVDYKEGRDRPDKAFVSRISPYLHFGHISPRLVKMKVEETMEDSQKKGVIQAGESYIREIFWREFSYHLLYYFPQTTTQPLKEHFKDFRWSQSKKSLEAWQQGKTGYPIVDAGMRQLWKTGWMHNRVRMIVASFLTKDLFIHWKEGADWFWDTLVDADLANNTQGWQWTAGSGADASPYFRVFNPIGQGEKFDPDGNYVRTYVPELADMPAKHIHCPWEAPEDVLKEAGVALGKTYPHPIVDHAQARKEALARYDEIRVD